MSVAKLDSGGTDNRWTATSAAAMGGGRIAMDVVGRGENNGSRQRNYDGCWRRDWTAVARTINAAVERHNKQSDAWTKSGRSHTMVVCDDG